MKSVYKNIFVFFLGLIALYSCMERVEVNLTSSEFITFEATMGGKSLPEQEAYLLTLL